LNVWGIRFEPTQGRLLGEAFSVTAYTGTTRILGNVFEMEIGIARDSLVLPIVDSVGGIWMLEDLDLELRMSDQYMLCRRSSGSVRSSWTCGRASCGRTARGSVSRISLQILSVLRERPGELSGSIWTLDKVDR
jgi:hypothetical protein